ncbi:MAG: hypothetical protein F4077_04970, partial [Gammaproteobacteria bacterium]|nr:hypothetical protein [Gammaproteobacteria bacterium]MYI77100.1 hypothetical protein [Gammaproteobacteria bacterium]
PPVNYLIDCPQNRARTPSVVAIGNPLGLQNTVTAGIVSGLGREGLGFKEVEGYIQTDATTNLGSSGGPLLSSSGEFIGVNIAGLAHTGSFIGIGFAIPSNLVSNVLEQLIALDGITTREHLGIEETSVDMTDSESSRLKENGDGIAGVKVTEVFEGTVAFLAGIRVNDVITSFRDEPISDMRDFLFQLKISQIEELVPIEIRRGPDVLTVYALIEPPMFDGDRYHWTLSGSLLMKVEFLDESSNENSELVEVVSIRPNSQASKIGLAKGDVILGVTEHSSFGPSANVGVSREGSVLTLTVRDD